MQLYKDYIICSNESLGAIYNIPQSRLITVNTTTAIEIKRQFEEDKLSKEAIEFLNKNFNHNKCNNKKYFDDFIKDKKFKKVQFLVTNNCNLNCVYCYASGGSYKRKLEKMSFDVVDKIIEFLVNYSEEIESVQFFGGEPLIEYRTIMRICDKFNENFKTMPSFVMVSNFTILPREFIEYIKKYNIQITVSLDGPAEITNKLRLNKNKLELGTFELVSKNIRKLRTYGLDINAIECTYTESHKKLGYDKSYLYEYFKNEFNIDKVIIADEEILGEEQVTPEFNEEKVFTEYSEESLYNTVSLTRALFTKKLSKYHCGVGFTTLSFTPNGDIYPCHRFFSNKEYYMGNIFDTNIFSSDEFNNVRKILRAINKEENNKCKNCKARNICSRCPASILTIGKDNYDIQKCEIYNSIIENLILKFIDFHKSEYKNFMSELKESNTRYGLV